MGKFKIEVESISKIIIEVDAKSSDEAQALVGKYMQQGGGFYDNISIDSDETISWEIKKVEEL